jgi:hypothetical protein
MVNHTTCWAACVNSYDECTFSNDDVEVLYWNSQDAHIYAIRGTEIEYNLMDVLRDLAFWRKEIRDIDVHYGFVKGWLSIKDKVLEHYASTTDDKPMVLTGHSMGGAIATIGAFDLMLSEWTESMECVSFGAPRCINKEDDYKDEAGHVEKVVTSYVHYRDPIPSSTSFAGYDYINDQVLGADKKAPWYKKRFRFHSIMRYNPKPL